MPSPSHSYFTKIKNNHLPYALFGSDMSLVYKCLSKYTVCILINIITIINYVGPVAQSVWRLSYGLDSPGSNPGRDEIFRPSRPALEPTQPPGKWVPGLSPGVKCGRSALLTTHPLLVPRSWNIRAIHLPTLLGHTGPVTGSLYLYY